MPKLNIFELARRRRWFIIARFYEVSLNGLKFLDAKLLYYQQGEWYLLKLYNIYILL